ncbi:FadR/GntR family transcriptional regulator [Oleispirillum naphthae]|uniref:FadR/GntR family transcriptional regulator n=1 Tax=Oleispirillum naphthae TaxID=2838853 RepID=UPI0030824F19
MTDIDTQTLDFTPIARRQISGEVARQIQHLIATRRLREGDRLPTERELAVALNVGRGAVREGLKLLAGLGIIEARQGAGSFVKEPQRLVLLDPSLVGSEERLDLLKQATETRRVLDVAVTEIAAATISDEDLEEIRVFLEKMDAEPRRTKLSHSIDLTFEAMIAKATGNLYLAAVQDEAHRYFRATWEKAGFMPRPAVERSEQHWAIFEALAAHDPKAARARMEEHLALQALHHSPSR